MLVASREDNNGEIVKSMRFSDLYPSKQLESIVTDYDKETTNEQYTTNDNYGESKSVSRAFSKQKQTIIDNEIDNKIKLINTENMISGKLTYAIKYAIDMVNDNTLKRYENDILSFCNKEAKMTPRELGQMGRYEFSKIISEKYCKDGDDKDELVTILGKFYSMIGQYGEYKQLQDELTKKQINSCEKLCKKLTKKQNFTCCSCNCNVQILHPSLQVYKRQIFTDKMVLRYKTSNEANEQQATAPISEHLALSTAPEEDRKYPNEDENNDDVDGGKFSISYHDRLIQVDFQPYDQSEV